MFEHYAEYEHALAAGQLIFVMIAMGTKLAPREFIGLVRRPRSLAMGLGCQLLFVPFLAVTIARLGNFGPGVSLGLLLVSAMPGGPSSTLLTHLGGGNAALAISLTTVTTFLSVVTVPLLLQLFGPLAEGGAVSLPVDVVAREIVVFLLLPLFCGMAAARVFPGARKNIGRGGVAIGMTLLFLLVAGSLGSGRIRPAQYGWRTPLAIVAFCVLAQQGSMLPFRLAGWPPADRLAVGVEMTIRDLNLALLLKARLVPAGEGPDPLGDAVLFVILFYGGTSLLAAAGTTLVFRLRHPPLEEDGKAMQTV